MTKSVLLVGVGGQGTILTSKILSEGLVRLGYEVKMSEIHGMAQRGGSVTTQIRYGERVWSPIIGAGEADLLAAFEKVEALRYLPALKKGGTLIVNDYEIYSLPVLTGQAVYPDDLNRKLARAVPNFKLVAANRIAGELGNARAQNVVLLGLMVRELGLAEHDWPAVVKRFVPEKFLALNLAAFEKGLAWSPTGGDL